MRLAAIVAAILSAASPAAAADKSLQDLLQGVWRQAPDGGGDPCAAPEGDAKAIPSFVLDFRNPPALTTGAQRVGLLEVVREGDVLAVWPDGEGAEPLRFRPDGPGRLVQLRPSASMGMEIDFAIFVKCPALPLPGRALIPE